MCGRRDSVREKKRDKGFVKKEKGGKVEEERGGRRRREERKEKLRGIAAVVRIWETKLMGVLSGNRKNYEREREGKRGGEGDF